LNSNVKRILTTFLNIAATTTELVALTQARSGRNYAVPIIIWVWIDQKEAALVEIIVVILGLLSGARIN
jgi:hypothetical protein